MPQWVMKNPQTVSSKCKSHENCVKLGGIPCWLYDLTVGLCDEHCRTHCPPPPDLTCFLSWVIRKIQLWWLSLCFNVRQTPIFSCNYDMFEHVYVISNINKYLISDGYTMPFLLKIQQFCDKFGFTCDKIIIASHEPYVISNLSTVTLWLASTISLTYFYI